MYIFLEYSETTLIRVKNSAGGIEEFSSQPNFRKKCLADYLRIQPLRRLLHWYSSEVFTLSMAMSS
jgi:hypothetical protein